MPRKSEPKISRLDLPLVKVSRLRALRIINPAMDSAEIQLAGLKRRVGLWHMHFPQGGSWSYFLCPHCGRKCQILRLHDGRLTCRLCDGLGRDRGKNIERIRKNIAWREHDTPGRRTAEASLRRALIAKRREKLLGWPPKGP
jgi:hypothetical protein